MNKGLLRVLVLVLFSMVLTATGYAQSLSIGSGSGAQGDTLTIPITFTNAADAAVGTNFDVTFDPALVSITGVAAGSALTGTAFTFNSSFPSAGTARVLVTPPLVSPFPVLPSGQIAVLTVQIVAASGTAALTGGNAFWSDANGVASPITAITNGSVTISVAPTTFDLNVTVNPTAGGTVTGGGINCPGTCSVTDIADGTVVPLVAAPAEGYQFTGWTGDAAACGTNTTCNVTMNSDKNVTANFEPVAPPPAFDLNVTVNPAEGGTVTGGGINCPGTCSVTDIATGTVVTLVAAPAENYEFTGWTGDAAACGTNTTCDVTMDSDKNVQANFQAVAPPPVIPTANEWGMILFMVLMTIVSVYYMRKQGMF